MGILDETYTLANGIEIPRLQLGTWFIEDGEPVAEAVRAAVRLGYRGIDTAQAYGNETGVGEGMRTCGIPRDQVFVVSKVAAEHKSYEEAAASIDATLERMGLDYLDMMIIHAPQPWSEFREDPRAYDEGNREAWRALEDAYEAGKLRAIGVSNFQEDDLRNILTTCHVKPMVNQVLAHIGNVPTGLAEFCASEGIRMEAYSPIAHGEALSQPVIVDTAARYDVTPAQLCIRYVLQLGYIALPKTANPGHMAANANVDFQISDEDMDALGTLSFADYGEFTHFPVFSGK